MLGVNQQTEGASQRDAQGFGDPAGEAVVEDDDGAGGFEGQSEDAGFTGPELAGERQGGSAARLADGDLGRLRGSGKSQPACRPWASSISTVCGMTMPPVSRGRIYSSPS